MFEVSQIDTDKLQLAPERMVGHAVKGELFICLVDREPA